jgi:hypothetical protein
VDKLILEIDSATERDLTLVEDRIKSLRELLEKADRRIADIDRRIVVSGREQERRRTQEAAYAALGRQPGLAKSAKREKAENPRVLSLSRGKAGDPPDRKADSAAPAVAEASAEAAAEAADTPHGPAPSANSPADGTPPVSAAPQELPLFVRADREIEIEAPSFTEQAAKLSREGFSPDIIALRLGATVAEVELALAISGGP